MTNKNEINLKVDELRQNSFLEKALETYLPETRVHEKLGDIHKNRIQRLTDYEKDIIDRYEKLNLKNIPSDWEFKYNQWNQLIKRPDITPEQYQTLLNSAEKHSTEYINELEAKPSQAQLNQAINDKQKAELDLKNFLAILKQLLTKNEATGETLDDLGKYIDNLKNDLLTSQGKGKDNIIEIANLKNQLKLKQAEIEQLKKQSYKPANNGLIEEINKKITQAYNSALYLNGYYEKLMKTFLDWEIMGSEEQKKAVNQMKPNINKCLTFLKNRNGTQ